MKVLQNTADFANSRSLSVLHGRLQLDKLRKERASPNSYVNNEPLNEQEIALFNSIYKQYKQKIIEEAHVSPDEAEKLLQSCIELYGKKNLVTNVAQLKLYKGVPAQWLFAEMIVSIIVTAGLQRYYDLSFVSCLISYFIIYFCITYAGGLYYQKRFAATASQEKITAILNGGGIHFYGKIWLGKK